MSIPQKSVQQCKFQSHIINGECLREINLSHPGHTSHLTGPSVPIQQQQQQRVTGALSNLIIQVVVEATYKNLFEVREAAERWGRMRADLDIKLSSPAGQTNNKGIVEEDHHRH